MPIEINEMKLTAYALGELFGAERAAVESRLSTDPEARQFVDEVRETARVVAGELAREPVVGLLAVHHAAIERRLEEPAPVIQYRGRKVLARGRQVAVMTLSIAASILIVGGVMSVLVPSLYAPMAYRDFARVERSTIYFPDWPGAELATVPETEPSPLADAETEAWNPPRPSNATAAAPSKYDPAPDVALGAGPGTGLGLGKGKRVPAAESALAPFGTPGSGGIATGQSVTGSGGLRIAGLPRRDGGWAPQVQPTDYDATGQELYGRIIENPFQKVIENPLSTFSIDTDTAAYSNVRRFLNDGKLPPADAVRLEELVNYFPYDYEGPKGDAPFAAHIEVAQCPWNIENRLVRVALKGKTFAPNKRPACNLVFLVDVSGSMNEANKLPLVKQGLRMLVEQLTPADRVTLITYAGHSGVALPPTSGKEKQKIIDAIESLTPGGSTNGSSGIQLAYETAVKNFARGGVNRVILCTDGDFNVGITSQPDLIRLIEDKAKSNVFLSVLGFGMNNLNDYTMETLADKGNGQYAYIDTQLESYKVLVEQMAGTLVTIAKDVKVQIEFNPQVASGYRLIGYENRLLAKEDFNDDQKDAGEIGAGHTVTALYEVVPAGRPVPGTEVYALKYQTVSQPTGSDELLTLKVRYKPPESSRSRLMEFAVKDAGASYSQATADFKFAASVASFGMVLRDSQHRGSASFDSVLQLAAEGVGPDRAGYRNEFLDLVRKAKEIKG